VFCLILISGPAYSQVLKQASTNDSGPTKTVLEIPKQYAGTWRGKILGSLEIIFHLREPSQKEASWGGHFDVPAQNTKGLELVNIRMEGEEIAFELSGVPGQARYQGKFDAQKGTIEGRFRQGLVNSPVSLVKDQAVPSALTPQIIDSLAEKLLKQWNAPGLALAVVKDGKILHSAGYGFRNVEKQEKMTPDSLLAIGSCTKAFTTTLLAGLVEQGKLEWDKPVQEFWPEFRLFDRQASELVTLRDMVTHRTGLPRHDLIWFAGELTRDEIMRRIPHLPPAEPLRQKWIYNNLMFVSAAAAAERATGSSWEELVRSRILDPLEMKRTNFHIDELINDQDHATGYHARGVKKDGFLEKPYREIAGMAPAGSINSSVNEMSKWVAYQLGNLTGQQNRGLPSRKSLEQLHSPQMVSSSPDAGQKEILGLGYAMGWGVESYRGKLNVRHGGAIDGFVAMVSLFPHDNFGVVALVNQSGNGLPGIISRILADVEFGFKPIEWSEQALGKIEVAEAVESLAKNEKESLRIADTKPSHPLNDYLGVFHHPGYGNLEIKNDSENICVVYGITNFGLKHWHYDQFVTREVKPEDDAFENKRFVFHTDNNGKIDAVSVDLEPMTAPIRFQRAADPRTKDKSFLEKLSGEYELPTQVLKIELQGDHLKAILPGQPVYDLIPKVGLTFQFKGLTGFQMHFKMNDEQNVQEVRIEQPNGVFIGKRKAP
jgi:CubicO group peptidase (beta-lactamase class C family)